MKKKLVSLFLLLLLAIALKAYADSYSVTITNTQSEAVYMRLNLSNSTYQYATVNGYNNYNTTIGASLVSLTINNQTVPIGTEATVYLPDLTPVRISWGGNGSDQIV